MPQLFSFTRKYHFSLFYFYFSLFLCNYLWNKQLIRENCFYLFFFLFPVCMSKDKLYSMHFCCFQVELDTNSRRIRDDLYGAAKWVFKHRTKKKKRKKEGEFLPWETHRKADIAQTSTRSKLNVLYRNQQWSDSWENAIWNHLLLH